MDKEKQIRAELRNALGRLRECPETCQMVEDVVTFCIKTAKTPWAESPLEPEAKDIVQKYSGTNDWDAFQLLFKASKLAKPEETHGSDITGS